MMFVLTKLDIGHNLLQKMEGVESAKWQAEKNAWSTFVHMVMRGGLRTFVLNETVIAFKIIIPLQKIQLFLWSKYIVDWYCRWYDWLT